MALLAADPLSQLDAFKALPLANLQVVGLVTGSSRYFWLDLLKLNTTDLLISFPKPKANLLPVLLGSGLSLMIRLYLMHSHVNEDIVEYFLTETQKRFFSAASVTLQV